MLLRQPWISTEPYGSSTYPDCEGEAVSPEITFTPSTLVTTRMRAPVQLRMRTAYSWPGTPSIQLRLLLG